LILQQPETALANLVGAVSVHGFSFDFKFLYICEVVWLIITNAHN